MRHWPIYMCQYFSKIEDQCSQIIKQAAKEAFENNMHDHGTIRTIAKVYLSNRESSVQDSVYHILSDLKLSRIFPAVYFNNINLLEERVQVLLPKRNLVNYPMIDHIFSRDQILSVIWKDKVQHSAMEDTVL